MSDWKPWLFVLNTDQSESSEIGWFVLCLAGAAVGVVLTRFALDWLQSKSEPRPPWSLRFSPFTIFEAFMIFFGLQVAGAAVLSMLAEGGKLENHTEVLVGLLIVTVANATVVAYLQIKNRLLGGIPADFGLVPDKLHNILGWSLVAYLAFTPVWVGLSSAQEMILNWLGTKPPIQNAVQALQEDDQVAFNIPLLFGVCVVTPILEEFIFRGFLMGMMRRFMAPIVAILISAVLFTLVHDAGRIQVFLLGLFLSLVYERTRRLSLCIAIHFWHNSITVLIIHLLREPTPNA